MLTRLAKGRTLVFGCFVAVPFHSCNFMSFLSSLSCNIWFFFSFLFPQYLVHDLEPWSICTRETIWFSSFYVGLNFICRLTHCLPSYMSFKCLLKCVTEIWNHVILELNLDSILILNFIFPLLMPICLSINMTF